MKTRPTTATERDRGTSQHDRRWTVKRSAIVVAGAMLVLSIAVPGSADECTSSTTTDTLVSSSCEGTAGVTSEDDTTTASTALSVDAGTSAGPAEVDGNLAVEEQESLNTPSHTLEGQDVTLPGTRTPTATVTTPRVDIREPINIRAGGRTTVPSVSLGERRVSTRTLHVGVPDRAVNVQLFGDAITGQPVRPGAGSGHLVEGTHGGRVAPASTVMSGGPDGYVATGTRGGSVGLAASAPDGSVSTGGVSPGSTFVPAPVDGSLDRSGGPVAEAASVRSSTQTSDVHDRLDDALSGHVDSGSASRLGGAIAMLLVAAAGSLVVARRGSSVALS